MKGAHLWWKSPGGSTESISESRGLAPPTEKSVLKLLMRSSRIYSPLRAPPHCILIASLTNNAGEHKLGQVSRGINVPSPANLQIR